MAFPAYSSKPGTPNSPLSHTPEHHRDALGAPGLHRKQANQDADGDAHNGTTGDTCLVLDAFHG